MEKLSSMQIAEAGGSSSIASDPDELSIADILDGRMPDEYQANGVLPGLARGQSGIVAGGAKIGKSMLSCQIATSIAVGRDMTASPDCSGIGIRGRGRAVYIAMEDSKKCVWDRIKALSARLSGEEKDLLRKNLCVVVKRGRLDVLGSGAGYILEKATGASLVVLDTLSHFHAVNENKTEEMLPVAMCISDLAAESKAAIVVLHHVNKQALANGVRDPSVDVRGSLAIVDELRWGGILASMTPDEARECGLDGKDQHGRLKRRRFVRFGIPSVAEIDVPPDVWLERGADGFFSAVNLQFAKKGIKAGRAGSNESTNRQGSRRKRSAIKDLAFV